MNYIYYKYHKIMINLIPIFAMTDYDHENMHLIFHNKITKNFEVIQLVLSNNFNVENFLRYYKETFHTDDSTINIKKQINEIYEQFNFSIYDELEDFCDYLHNNLLKTYSGITKNENNVDTKGIMYVDHDYTKFLKLKTNDICLIKHGNSNAKYEKYKIVNITSY